MGRHKHKPRGDLLPYQISEEGVPRELSSLNKPTGWTERILADTESKYNQKELHPGLKSGLLPQREVSAQVKGSGERPLAQPHPGAGIPSQSSRVTLQELESHLSK